MPAPHALFPFMEGVIGSIASTQVTTQLLTDWYRAARSIMLSPNLRGLTTWDFFYSADIDETGVAYGDTGVLYGALIGQASADASQDVVYFTDAASNTASAAEHPDDNTDDLALLRIPVATTDLTREWHGFLFWTGLPFATNLTVAADGIDGTNPDTNDIHGWVLVYTT